MVASVMTKMNASSWRKDGIAILYEVQAVSDLFRRDEFVSLSAAAVHGEVFRIFASFFEVIALIQWSFYTFCVQRTFPKFSVPTSFLFCCNVGMVFQRDFVVLHDTFLILPTIRQRFAVFYIFIPLVQNIFVIVPVSLLQHIMCFVVHVLSHRRSMFGSICWILFDNVAGDCVQTCNDVTPQQDVSTRKAQ